MSPNLMLDVILGTTPVPGLSAAYTLLKIIVSSVQQAREGKRQLEALAYAVAQLLDTLNTEFRASRLVQSSSPQPLQDLYSLLEDIQCYIREEQERPFLRALFSLDSPTSDIEGFYRRIGTVASAFQISALLNIQRTLSNDERARSQEFESVQARLRTMELNQIQLWRTAGLNLPAGDSTQGQLANGAVFQSPQSPTGGAANLIVGWPQATNSVSWPQNERPPHSTALQTTDPVAPRKRILINPREDPQYHGFANRSAYPVKYNGKEYPSSEHLFQALKYMDNRPDIAEKIRTTSKSPMKAFKYSMSQLAHQHPDWNRMRTAKMEIALYHKFTQHDELKQALLRTGNAELIHLTRNSLWGVGKDQKGKNEQGKALERVRNSLQEGRRPK